jgi:hypothetical protein
VKQSVTQTLKLISENVNKDEEDKKQDEIEEFL